MKVECLRTHEGLTYEGFKQFVGDSTFSVLTVKPACPSVKYTAYIAHKVSIEGNLSVIYTKGTNGEVPLCKDDVGVVLTNAVMKNPEGLSEEDLKVWEFVSRSQHMRSRHTAYKEALKANDPDGGVLSYVVKTMFPSPIPYSVLDDVAREVRKWAEESYSAR